LGEERGGEEGFEGDLVGEGNLAWDALVGKGGRLLKAREVSHSCPIDHPGDKYNTVM